MRFAIVAALALLAGCASVGDLRSKEPVWVGTSDKNSASYTACVMEGWRDKISGPINSAVPGGHEIVVTGVTADIVLRAMDKPGGGVDIRLSSRLPYGYRSLVDTAESCV